MHNEIVFNVKDAVKGRIHASLRLWCEQNYNKTENYLFSLYVKRIASHGKFIIKILQSDCKLKSI